MLTLYPFKLYIRHVPNLLLIVGSALVNVAVWGWLLWEIRPREGLLFLHYNVLFGVDLIGEWWQVFWLPAGGTIILLVNALLGWAVFRSDRFAPALLLSAAAVCQVFLLVAAALLIFLNV